MSIRLREFTRVSKADKIDRDAGVLYGLVILGPDSANGRRYTEEAMRNGARFYEGRPANVNHVPHGGSVSAYDRLGVWYRPRFEGGKIRGDFHYLKSHPLADRLVEAAERPELNQVFGFSHDAEGSDRHGSNGTIIESIDNVWSVDLVGDPATVKGLYESLIGGKRVMAKKKKRSRFREQDPLFTSVAGGSGGDDDPLNQAVALLRQCVADAGPRHDEKYIEDLKEALEILGEWADSSEDDDSVAANGVQDNSVADQEWRRRNAGNLTETGRRNKLLGGGSDPAADKARKARVGRLRSGRY